MNGKPGEILMQMLAIQADVSAIAKERQNRDQNYKFRGIDQVVEMLHPLLVLHGVLVLPQVVKQERGSYQTKSGSHMQVTVLTVDWHFVARDGSERIVTTIGEGADISDKASNKAMTAAQKYCYTLAFSVPWSDQEDGDQETPAARRPGPAPAPRPPESFWDLPVGWGRQVFHGKPVSQHTWREMAEGAVNGGRMAWLQSQYAWLTEESQARDQVRARKAAALLPLVTETIDEIRRRALKQAGLEVQS